jgi:hypothetical protein
MIINISRPEDYYSQRNNEIRGSSACNATSAAMFIETSGIKPFKPADMSLDDFIMATLLSKEGYEKMFAVAPGFYPVYPPNEVHACLSWAINRICEKEVTKFIFDATMKQILFSVIKGKPVILSGRFSGLDHIVLLVGFETSQEDVKEVASPEDIQFNRVTSFFIDDPWGDPNTNYKSHSGDDIKMSAYNFMNSIKPIATPNAKWAHFHTDILKII